MALTMQTDNKYYLVVVADESRAVLYHRERRRGPMQEAGGFENEAARLKTDDLIADRGGRAFDSHGQGRHTMTAEKSDPKQHRVNREPYAAVAKNVVGQGEDAIARLLDR